jgi:hypothetical protein
MSRWLYLPVGLGVAAGMLLAEVCCMLLEGQLYPAAVACAGAVLILASIRWL